MSSSLDSSCFKWEIKGSDLTGVCARRIVKCIACLRLKLTRLLRCKIAAESRSMVTELKNKISVIDFTAPTFTSDPLIATYLERNFRGIVESAVITTFVVRNSKSGAKRSDLLQKKSHRCLPTGIYLVTLARSCSLTSYAIRVVAAAWENHSDCSVSIYILFV